MASIYNKKKKFKTILIIAPAPVGPTIAVVVPAGTVKLIPFKPFDD